MDKNFPHIAYMVENDIKIGEITQDYLIKEINSWASAKTKYDLVEKEGVYADAAEREQELTEQYNKLMELSNTILEDLKTEFPPNDGYEDVALIQWPHIERMNKYSIKTIDLPDDVAAKIKKFNAQFQYLKDTSWADQKEQAQEIQKAMELSKQIEIDVKTHLAQKTTKAMDDFQTKKLQQKEDKAKQDRIDKLTAEIKSMVTDQHEFTKVTLKVDELKELTDTKDLEKWIETEKEKYYAELRAKMGPEKYIEQLLKDKKTEISSADLKDFKEVKLPKKPLVPDLMSGGKTSVVVGKYELVSVDFGDKWKIREYQPPKEKPKEKDSEKDSKEKAGKPENEPVAG